eukprot:TRINITY_DN32914_c0_g1_i1.p1 TRINITY_DN32914_c0_g1~~TRINITY_DN32914_c0_g1_i1.p1  ORF type:complete len:238 (+),score=58.43 TRINITY_DN32914_c0_g1_i1:45-758(+)
MARRLVLLAFGVAAVSAADPCASVPGQNARVCDDQRYGYYDCYANGSHSPHQTCGQQDVCTAINATAATCSGYTDALTCVANRSATPDVLGGALGWVCGQEDCTAVNEGGDRYYPNTLVSHADWAFNKYFETVGKQFSNCQFSGAAEMLYCNPDCYKCNVKPGADPAKLGDALGWVCGPDGLGNCDAIMPGGAHYEPNTPTDHANWAFNEYYQALKCWQDGAWPCDFGGVAETVPCQ